MSAERSRIDTLLNRDTPHGRGDPVPPGGYTGLVVAPAHPSPSDRAAVVFEVRRRPDGSRALPVFSSVRQLVAALGPAQPWAALPMARVLALMGTAGVGQVVLDPPAEQGTWRWQPEDLQDLALGYP